MGFYGRIAAENIDEAVSVNGGLTPLLVKHLKNRHIPIKSSPGKPFS